MNEKQFQDDSMFMLMKFGTKERLESLQKGSLYMKNLLYFINLEKNNPTSNEGQGDMFEGQSVIYNPIVEIRDYHTKTLVYRGSAELSATSFGYENYPVFCMFMLDSRNLVNKKIEDGKVIRSYQFTNEQAERIAREFGDHALVLFNTAEFIRRVENRLKADDIEYVENRVQYYEPNDFDYFKDTHSDSLSAAFWKRRSYSFQQEFRILLHKRVNDHLRISIGDISDISQIFKATDLLNSQIDTTLDI